VSERKRGRRGAAEIEPPAYVRWINGRAYAELGSWAAWGGRRQEPLREYGEKFATNDPDTAAILLGYRLRELRDRRDAERAAAAAAVPVPTAITSFIGYHLSCKAQEGRRAPSDRELNLLRTRLIHAGKFFHSRGGRDLREITCGDVTAYVKHLQEEVGSAPGHAGRRVDYLNPVTQRRYLTALSNMLKRAKNEGIIKTNFVADLIDRVE
jgi:hypothetical protein